MGMSVVELPYLACNATLLSALEQYGQVAYLGSSSPQHQDGAWSILSASQDSVLNGQTGDYSPETLYQTCQDWMANIPTQSSTSDYDDLPFIGGILGHLSYDFGVNLLKIKSAHQPKLPALDIIFCSWAYLWNHVELKCYLVHWPELSSVGSDVLTKLFNDSLASRQSPKPFTLKSPFQPSWQEEDYKEKFDRIKAYIYAGDAYQINLTQHFSAKYDGAAASAFVNLFNRAEVPFATYWKSQFLTWASASPERFISVNGNKVQTRPIKGTRPRTFNASIDEQNALDLKQHPKDNAENLMIVDLLRNDLSKNCDKVTVPALFEVEWFPTVLHLVSTIEGELRPNTTPLQLLLEAFPGGSITGTPKKRAMEIIDELEFTAREHYCGSTFYWSANQRFDSNILIRSFMFDDQKVHCWGGGGIVADSECAAEYQESLDKVGKLMQWLEAD